MLQHLSYWLTASCSIYENMQFNTLLSDLGLSEDVDSQELLYKETIDILETVIAW